MEKVISTTKGKSFIFAVCSFIFVLIGVFMFIDTPSVGFAIMLHNSGLYYPLALLCILFFGFCGTYYLYLSFVSKPLYIISKQGLTFKKRVFAPNDLLVPWQDIKTATVAQVIGGTRFIVLNLKDDKKYIHSGFYDKYLKGLSINIKICDISEPELIQELSKHIKISK